jgi:hypothetical protein
MAASWPTPGSAAVMLAPAASSSSSNCLQHRHQAGAHASTRQHRAGTGHSTYGVPQASRCMPRGYGSKLPGCCWLHQHGSLTCTAGTHLMACSRVSGAKLQGGRYWLGDR